MEASLTSGQLIQAMIDFVENDYRPKGKIPVIVRDQTGREMTILDVVDEHPQIVIIVQEE